MSSELGVQGSRAGALPSSTMTIRGRGGVPEALTPVTFSQDCVTCYVAKLITNRSGTFPVPKQREQLTPGAYAFEELTINVSFGLIDLTETDVVLIKPTWVLTTEDPSPRTLKLCHTVRSTGTGL